jgi:hypothetical protein
MRKDGEETHMLKVLEETAWGSMHSSHVMLKVDMAHVRASTRNPPAYTRPSDVVAFRTTITRDPVRPCCLILE